VILPVWDGSKILSPPPLYQSSIIDREQKMKLIDKDETRGIIKAGELLLTPTDALEFIEKIEQRGILILGVDLWCYIGDQIAEDPNSLDLSEIDNHRGSVAIAREFITHHLPEGTAFVSFVVEE